MSKQEPTDALRQLVEDISVKEIASQISQGNLSAWCNILRNEMKENIRSIEIEREMKQNSEPPKEDV